MLNAQALAQELHNAISQKTDGFGKPTLISDQTLNYSKGIVAALTAGIVSNAPGTIVGTTAPGAPLTVGAGAGGTMILQSSLMKAITAIGVPPQAVPNIAKENDAIINYIMTGLITFAPGAVVGNCTNTASNPGPLVAGAATGGLIAGLTPPGAVSAVSAALGFTGPEMMAHYTALISYILSSAQVNYSPNSIVGVCPPGGGPLTAGAGSGGTIS